MATSLLRKLSEPIPPEQRRFVLRRAQLAKRIASLLRSNGWTRHQLAEQTGLKESYISRVVSGAANLTLETIATIENALGREVFIVPDDDAVPLPTPCRAIYSFAVVPVEPAIPLHLIQRTGGSATTTGERHAFELLTLKNEVGKSSSKQNY